MEEGEWEGKERERERWQGISGRRGKQDAYLTHGCGFADGRIFSVPIGEGILFSRSEFPLIASENSFALLPSMEEESCGVLGQVSVSAPNVVLRRQRDRARQTTYKQRWLATSFPLCVLGVASHWLR